MAGRAFPILSVEDLPAVRAFYEQLGFAVEYEFAGEDGAVAFCSLTRDRDALGLAAAGPAAGDQRPRVAYWLYVDDVDATYQALTAAGAPAVEAPADQPWGERSASVLDPEGTLVHLGQAIA